MSTRPLLALALVLLLPRPSAAALPDGHWQLVSHAVPATLAPGAQVEVPVTLRNRTAQVWSEDRQDRLAYHWRAEDGSVIEWDGRRTHLPGPLLPGEAVTLQATIKAPTTPGRYYLQFEPVREHRRWWGAPSFTRDIVITVDVVGVDAELAWSIEQVGPMPALAAGTQVEIPLRLHNAGDAPWSPGRRRPPRLSLDRRRRRPHRGHPYAATRLHRPRRHDRDRRPCARPADARHLYARVGASPRARAVVRPAPRRRLPDRRRGRQSEPRPLHRRPRARRAPRAHDQRARRHRRQQRRHLARRTWPFAQLPLARPRRQGRRVRRPAHALARAGPRRGGRRHGARAGPRRAGRVPTRVGRRTRRRRLVRPRRPGPPVGDGATTC